MAVAKGGFLLGLWLFAGFCGGGLVTCSGIVVVVFRAVFVLEIV